MKIAILVGYPRAGKDTFADFLTEFGFKKYVFSEALAEWAGVDPSNKKALSEAGVRARKKLGRDAVAKLVWKKMEKDRPEKAVVVGSRSPEEITFFAERAKIVVVEIRADKEKRLERGADEGRDRSDEALGLTECIKMADVVVENNGTLEELKEKAKFFAENFEYYVLGVKAGLEIHQQLDTHKLFCSCPSLIREDEPDIVVERYQRPVPSEMGEFDPAALAEFQKGMKYIYQAYSDTTCLVELDEEPPHPPNEEALDVALMVAEYMHMRPVDMIQVMRKIVIDGSNTTGFQRTMLIATDGYVDGPLSRVRIPTLCLEEDAARVIERGTDYIVYRLDRLGIPLVEISTGPDLHSPKEVRIVAERIGLLLRATGKVKRGLGTIRQDVNVSIRGGARVEIKGIQVLDLIDTYVQNEVMRQKTLLEIRDEMRKRGLTKGSFDQSFVDVSNVFKNTACKFISKALKSGKVVLGVKLRKMAGLLGREVQPGRRFGTELSDYAKVHAGVGGIIHSDELPAYGISKEEVDALRRMLKCGEDDAFVLVVDERGKAEKALSVVIERLKVALDGVPKETRGPNPDGTTRYMRPLPGAARMYPETDVAPIFITKDRLRKIRENLPPLPEERAEEYLKMGLNEGQVRALVRSRYVFLFDEMVAKGVEPKVAANILLVLLPYWRRKGWNLTEEQLLELALGYNRKYPKEVLDDIVPELAKGKNLDTVLKEKGISMVDENVIRRIVKSVIMDMQRQGEELRMNVIMGRVMEKLRGKAPGKTVAKIVNEILGQGINNE